MINYDKCCGYIGHDIGALAKIFHNQLRHKFEQSWPRFSAEKFARRRKLEFEEAPTRRSKLLIFDWN